MPNFGPVRAVHGPRGPSFTSLLPKPKQLHAQYNEQELLPHKGFSDALLIKDLHKESTQEPIQRSFELLQKRPGLPNLLLYLCQQTS